MKQIGIASAVYSHDSQNRIAWLNSYGMAQVGAMPSVQYVPLFNPKEVYMENAFAPYLGTNKSAAPASRRRSGKTRRKPVYLPLGHRRDRPPANADSGDEGFDNNFYYGNDGVTYPFMVTYSYYDPGDPNGSGGNNVTHPITNRRTSDVYISSMAVLVWEVPYHSVSYMPHNRGMNVAHADGSAVYFKGLFVKGAGEPDWYLSNSYLGWDPPGAEEWESRVARDIPRDFDQSRSSPVKRRNRNAVTEP